MTSSRHLARRKFRDAMLPNVIHNIMGPKRHICSQRADINKFKRVKIHFKTGLIWRKFDIL